MEKVDAKMRNGLLSREMRWNWKKSMSYCAL